MFFNNSLYIYSIIRQAKQMQNKNQNDVPFNSNINFLCSISDSNNFKRQISYLDFMHDEIHFFNKDEELDISHIQPKAVKDNILDDHILSKEQKKCNFKQNSFERQITYSIDTIYLEKMAMQTIIPNVNCNFRLQKSIDSHKFEQKQINLAIKVIVKRFKKLIFIHYSQRLFCFLKTNLLEIKEFQKDYFQPEIKNITVSKYGNEVQIALENISKIISKRVIIQFAEAFSILQLNLKSNLYKNFISIFLITINKMMKKIKFRSLLYGFAQIKQFYKKDIQELRQMKKIFQNAATLHFNNFNAVQKFKLLKTIDLFLNYNFQDKFQTQQHNNFNFIKIIIVYIIVSVNIVKSTYNKNGLNQSSQIKLLKSRVITNNELFTIKNYSIDKNYYWLYRKNCQWFEQVNHNSLSIFRLNFD